MLEINAQTVSDTHLRIMGQFGTDHLIELLEEITEFTDDNDQVCMIIAVVRTMPKLRPGDPIYQVAFSWVPQEGEARYATMETHVMYQGVHTEHVDKIAAVEKIAQMIEDWRS